MITVFIQSLGTDRPEHCIPISDVQDGASDQGIFYLSFIQQLSQRAHSAETVSLQP